jgi:hypothetical protein
MPKAILKFNLPEEKSEFEAASKAMALALTVLDIDQYLRNQIKHNDAPKEVEAVREELFAILESRNINLDMIA